MPEHSGEGCQIKPKPRVAPKHVLGELLSPAGQGGEDDAHLGPVGQFSGGIGPGVIPALLQETQTFVGVPRVTFGKRGVRFRPGNRRLPLGDTGDGRGRASWWEDRGCLSCCRVV